MNTRFLLPNRLKLPLLLAFGLSTAFALLVDKRGFEFSWLHHNGGNLSNDNLSDELALSGIILSLLALCCCRERIEDEYVRSIRLQSWLAAILVNYALIMLLLWTQFGLAFLGVLFYNILTPMIIYLLVFYLRMHILPRLGRKNSIGV